MKKLNFKRYLMTIASVLGVIYCHAQAPTKYGKYDISKLTPSVEYCGLEIRENSITLEVWNNHTNIDLSFSGEAKKDITTLIYENYEAKMPGIIDLFVKEKTAGETSSTVLRIGRGFLDDLIRKYNVWKANFQSEADMEDYKNANGLK